MRYAAKAATPGERFLVDVVLTSKTETPVDFIDTTLRGTETVRIGDGKGAYQRTFVVLEQTARKPEGVLAPGEHKYSYAFDLPRDAPPTYSGERGTVRYEFVVHVSIPWWPDRTARYVLPVLALPTTTALEGTPRIGASADGPKAGIVYAEVSIDSDVLLPGAVLAGAVSVSNTGAHRIRKVVAILRAHETITAPQVAHSTVEWLTAVLKDGAPGEGEAIPFRFAIPPGLPPSFVSAALRVAWTFVVQVDVAFGADAVVGIPVTVTRAPPGSPPRAPGRYYPVGRDRFALVWASVAKKLGMALDEDGRTLRASAGRASLVVRGAADGKGYALVVELAWERLGIGLQITTRSWTDVVAGGWRPPSVAAREKLLIRGREEEQLAALLDTAILDVLASYTTVSVDDERARLTLAVPGTNAPELEQACRSALGLLARVARWTEQCPPPRTLASAADAWRAFAERASGAFEPGSLSARGCSIGVDRYSVETYWLGTDQPLSTVVTFPFDPPLDREPTPESPQLSRDARELYGALSAEAKDLAATREELSWRVPGSVVDPATLSPLIATTASLVRALRGAAPLPYR
jgi:hypothetical protein